MITLDPDTAERTQRVLKKSLKRMRARLARTGAVIVEGMLHKGDPVELLD